MRLLVAKAILAFEFNAGPGAGFVSALAAFERAFNAIASLPDRQQAMQSDGGDTPPTQSKLNVEGWLAVFAAGAICCDSPVQAITAWHNEALRTWGAGSPVVEALANMSRGLTLSNQVAREVAYGLVERSIGERFGAALLIRPCEVSSCILDVTILEVGHDALGGFSQRGHEVIGSLT